MSGMPSLDAFHAEHLLRSLHSTRTVVEHGRVVQAVGTVLRATGLRARIGQQCLVHDAGPDAKNGLMTEVIGFAGGEAILAPYGALQGVAVGAAVQALADGARVPCGPALLGRVMPLADRSTTARSRPSQPARRSTPTRLPRSPVAASTTRCPPACAPSTPCSPSAKASASASLRWPAAASRRCWACWRARPRPTST
jgi:type III secretion protein N (ATPase)